MVFEQKELKAKTLKQTRQEYAEKSFDLYNLMRSGSEITIEERLDFSNDKVRIVNVKGFKDPSQTYPRYAIKVSDGLFTKDLVMKEEELIALATSLPQTLINIQGVVFKVNRGTGYEPKIEYLRCVRQDMNGNAYNASAPAQDAPVQQKPLDPARDINRAAEQLAEAVKANTAVGITTTYPILQAIADKIYPNRALDVIMCAKTKGCIADQGAEGYKGY